MRSSQKPTNPLPTKLFLWNWRGGGYNSCRAKDRDEAIEKAQVMASMLKPRLDTLRECTSAELAAEDKRWGPYD
jgi:hypothetical protein